MGGAGTTSTLSFPNVTEADLGLYQLKVDLEGERLESQPIALRIIGKGLVISFKFPQKVRILWIGINSIQFILVILPFIFSLLYLRYGIEIAILYISWMILA